MVDYGLTPFPNCIFYRVEVLLLLRVFASSDLEPLIRQLQIHILVVELQIFVCHLHIIVILWNEVREQQLASVLIRTLIDVNLSYDLLVSNQIEVLDCFLALVFLFYDWEHDRRIVQGTAAVQNGDSRQALAGFLNFLSFVIFIAILAKESVLVRLHDVELAIVGQTFMAVFTLAVVTIVLARQYLVRLAKFQSV